MKNKLTMLGTALLLCLTVFSQEGNLFIIGGGHKTKALMQQLVSTAQLKAGDYIAFLPMATTEPDTSYYYIKESFAEACSNKVVMFNFTKNDINKTSWIDSVRNAKLIYLGGGDQTRFMDIVLHTPIQTAILEAYKKGSTVAGTSAGAAMMAHYMITGNQLLGDTTYESTFPKLWDGNLEIKEGLGLLDSAIIDQHFVARSRYNRLLTAIAKYPTLPCIGIDEGTAIIVQRNTVKVAGTSQVIVFAHPKNVRVTKDGYIKFDDVNMHIYTEGDAFTLR